MAFLGDPPALASHILGLTHHTHTQLYNAPPPLFSLLVIVFNPVIHSKQGFYQSAVSPALECLKENGKVTV